MQPVNRNQKTSSGAKIDWTAVETELDTFGYGVIADVLDAKQCNGLIESYSDRKLFRSRVDMKRYGFGLGEYQYFAAPIPDLVGRLRREFYEPLAQIANRWNAALGQVARYPDQHSQFITVCHQAGQTKPTPLLLKYGAGDYNCLHQDVYGDLVFPLQVAVLLSEPEKDFTGGEFVITEQRPRKQSRAEIVPLRRGDGVVFPVRHRPVQGARGFYRANHRHGVSRLRSGSRYTLGIIFHDAQ